jgi:hypothetical protein
MTHPTPNDAMTDIERLADEYADAVVDWSMNGHPADKARAALLAAIGKLVSSTQPAMAWQPIETAPKDGRALLLGHFNSHGKWRTVRGEWCSEAAIAEGWEDPEAPEGWYETSVESDDVPNCWWTEPTHWQPLPPPPRSQVQGGLSTNNEEMK